MKHKYVYSKFIALTGKVIEGRGNTKAIAKKRFHKALEFFRNRRNTGLQEVNSFGHEGKVYVRKELAKHYLDLLEKEEKDVRML